MIEDRIIAFGPFELRIGERRLLRDGSVVDLGGRGMDLLIALAETPGTVIDQRSLLERAWPNMTVGEGSLRVAISGLRRALGEGEQGSRYIANVSGRGYCFVAPLKQMASASLLGPLSRPATLPAPRRLIGRDEVIDALARRLKESRFISLIGPGGMGKTSVAISAAHAFVDDTQFDAWFVDLAAISDPHLVPVAVAAALGASTQTDDIIPSLVGFLAERHTLLVLDNCEHVVAAAADLAEQLYLHTPHTHILVTSREALQVEGERVQRLAPLPFPAEGDVLGTANAQDWSAIELFVERATASGSPDFTDADMMLIGTICQRLDGIPLAIELAASRVGSVGLNGVMELFDDRGRLLRRDRRSSLSRHQTLHDMIDWSFNLLTAQEKYAFVVLGVFVGPFTLDAAMGIINACAEYQTATPEDLFALTEKSLVWTLTRDGVTLYRLPEVMRAFCLEKMNECPHRDGVMRWHAAYYAKALPCPSIETTDLIPDEIAIFSNQIGNFRAALEWCFSEAGDPALGVTITAATAPYWIHLSLLGECRRWCQASLATRGSVEFAPAAELALLEGFGIATLFTLGNNDHVLDAITRGLALAEKWKAAKRHLNFLAGRHIFLTRIGDVAAALDTTRKSADLVAAGADPVARAAVEWMMGCSLHSAGNYTDAIRHLEAGFRQASTLGAKEVDLFGYDHRVRALVTFARSLWLTGAPDHAEKIAAQAIEAGTRYENPVNLCIALIFAGGVSLWRGDFAEADARISRLIEQAHKNRLIPYKAVSQVLLGQLKIKRGQFDLGIDDLRAYLDLMRNERHNVLLPTALRALAEGYLALGSLDDAHRTVESALIDYAGHGNCLEHPELLRLQGRIRFRRGDLAGSRLSLTEAISVAQKQGVLGFALRAATELAEIERGNGHFDAALAALKPVYDRFEEGFETADLRRARKLLIELGGSTIPTR